MATSYDLILSKGAIQEYIEGLLFKSYILSGGKVLLTAKEISSGIKYPIDKKDYILGLLDFTGEIMKFGISHPLGCQIDDGVFIFPTEIVRTIRGILQQVDIIMEALYSNIDILLPGILCKYKTAKSSLSKMEKLIYNVQLQRKQTFNILDQDFKKQFQ